MGLLSFGLGGCSNAQNKQEHSNVKEIGNVPKENVDSYVYKNEGRPVYYAKYGNRGCLFELRVNDILMTEMTYSANIGEALITINPAIFKSGRQTVEIHLSPIKGEDVISNAKPFRLEIGYYDSTEEVDESGEATWHTVFTLPDIEIPEKGLPYIDMKGEFEANVPYQYTYWDDCVDLRTIPNIEQKIVKEYEYVRKLIAQKDSEQLKKYFMPSYQEFAITIYQTKEDIESIATDLEIPFLLHFTQATNLASILHHGIYSRGKAQDVGITSNINDNLRLDNRLNGTSLSIAHPNAKMLYKYRLENPNADWIVLAIAPSVLWEKDCVFCKKNAATKLIRGMPTSQLKTSQAFQSLFDDDVGIHNQSSRVKQNLYPCDPTDVQAEILVFDIIEPQYINAIIFEKSNVYKYYSSLLGEHPALISGDGIVDFFAPRTTLRKSKMINFIPKGEAK